jgi:anhydro-N-acetylmuramic acid kinase
MQLGDGNVIAERSGITTVADFRRRDVAAGGHGAPLVPAFHAALLHSTDEDRAVLNLGGIANFTLLPMIGAVRGFDTGPANALMDAWCERHRGQAFDADGAFAAQGEIDRDLLARLLAEPWFALPPPKSTGREQFHPRLGASSPCRKRARGRRAGDATGTQRHHHCRCTACAPTEDAPRSRLRRRRAQHAFAQPHRRAAAGCGRRNHGGTRSGSDFVEAMAFAWLARQTLAGLPGNVPSVTGARGPRVLGVVYPA